jgi:Protein of unknown function (DUF1360)
MRALILSLATARLTQLVVDDAITDPIREQIAQANDNPSPWSVLDEIVNCHACTSVWAGAGILVAEQTGVGRFLVRVLALSQTALAVKSVIERIDR